MYLACLCLCIFLLLVCLCVVMYLPFYRGGKVLAERRTRPPLASLTGCLPEFNELPVVSPPSHISLHRQPEWPDGTGAHLLIFVEGKKKPFICLCVSQVSVQVTSSV